MVSADPGSEARARSLASLQMGRGLAATAVVLFHARAYLLADSAIAEDAIPRVFGFGYAGVEFFFVLSGFIMMHVHREDVGKPARLARYAYKRAVRIYPAYWAALLALIAAYLVMPYVGLAAKPLDPGWIAQSLTLAPSERFPILFVGWTLEYELVFYALFGLMIFHRAIGLGAIAVWLFACAAALLWAEKPFPASFALSSYNLLFGMGLTVAWFLPRARLPQPILCLLIGLCIFLATGLQDVYSPTPMAERFRALSFGLGAALMVWGAAAAERAGRFATPRPLQFLGDASYSIYLVHAPAISLALKAAAPLALTAKAPPLALFAALAAFALAAGCMFHLLVERPIMGFFARARAARRSRAERT